MSLLPRLPRAYREDTLREISRVDILVMIADMASVPISQIAKTHSICDPDTTCRVIQMLSYSVIADCFHG